jgi:hypothetical protein
VDFRKKCLLRMILCHRNLERIAIGDTARRNKEIFHPYSTMTSRRFSVLAHIVPVIFRAQRIGSSTPNQGCFSYAEN